MSRVIPRGVIVAGLAKRFAAAIIDLLPIALIGGLVYGALQLDDSSQTTLVAAIVGAVLTSGYGLYQWWAYASRGAGLGARVMGVRLVGLKDGEPIGWWRFFLRQLVFAALMVTVVGGIALLVFLIIHERRQGWHDMVGGAVLVEPKPAEQKAATAAKKVPTVSTVGLPPHLASTFSPQPGTSEQSWESFAPSQPTQPAAQPLAPEWLPGVQSEPVNAQAPYAQPGTQPSGPVQQWSAPEPARAESAPQWQAPAPQWSAPERTEAHPAPSASEPPAHQPSAPARGMDPAEYDAPSGLPKPPQQSWIPLPTPAPVIEPPVRVRPREFGEVEEDEGTRIAELPTRSASGRPGNEGWYLRLDDGREVELTLPVLLGRNPQKAPTDPDQVHLVPASGDGRMISRTHVLVGSDLRGVFVVDRGSTNGTALVTEAGELEPCPADTQVRVREGQQVSYGNRWFTLLRRPEKLV